MGIRKIIYICALAVALCFLQGMVQAEDTSKYDTVVLDDYPVAHAMGGIDGHTYTNSLEAFKYNYGLGQRVFEADMQLTSDGRLVCAHDWEYSTEWAERVPAEEEFLRTPVDGKYTALSIEDLLNLMLEYEDAYIVTDTKYTDEEHITKQFSQIMDTVSAMGHEEILERFIVQIYNEEMYFTVHGIGGFTHYIYTLYQVWDGDPESFSGYVDFCAEHGISHITMWHYLASEEIIKEAEEKGIHVLVHTVNDISDARKLLALGVRNIYTDFITADALKNKAGPGL